MIAQRTRSPRLATIAMTLLSLTLLARLALAHHHSYVDVLLLAALAIAVGTTVAMHRVDSLETRVSALALSLLCASSVVLTAVAGVPGQPHQAVGVPSLATLAVSCVVLGLLVVDRRERPAVTDRGSPYAS